MQTRFLHLRTHSALVATLDALAARLRDNPELAHNGTFTRSDAARLAMLAGLRALEAPGLDHYPHGAQRLAIAEGMRQLAEQAALTAQTDKGAA